MESYKKHVVENSLEIATEPGGRRRAEPELGNNLVPRCEHFANIDREVVFRNVSWELLFFNLL